MTELELYKFVTKNNIEWHRHQNEGEEDIILLPYFFQLEELMKMIGNPFDEGVECMLQDGYAGIWMRDICEYHDIKMENVFQGEEV